MADNISVASPQIGDEERREVDRVLASGMLAQGPEVAAFEREFGDALADGMACVATNSGTSGAHLGLLACGIGPGDEVVVPSFTFAATANAVALTGATPVFADIEPDNFCLDAASVEAVLTPRTVGIMPVHLFGHPAPMTDLVELAQKYSLRIFEDAAQAHGAKLGGRLVGTWGEFGMFSLYPTKNMTSGEGGMTSCSDAAVARNMRLLRNQGMEQRYANEVVGFNARMTEIHAAIGRVQLRRLPAWTEQRRATAALFDSALEGVVVPPVAEQAEHVYHQYTVRITDDRDGFARALQEEFGIGTGVYYPTPVHRLPSYDLTLELPETERAAAEVLSLPVHPALSSEDVERVVEGVNTVAKAGA